MKPTWNHAPEQDCIQYGRDVTKQFSEWSEEDLEKFIDSPADIEDRFAAFYFTQAKLRRQYRYADHRREVEEKRHIFGDQPLMKFMIAESYGDLAMDEGDRIFAIELARNAVEATPNNPGVQHLLAEYLLESVELTAGQFTPEAVVHERLQEAEERASSAISLNGQYAKYHATKARILTLLDSPGRALESVNRAIQLEDGSTPVGAERIRSYQAIRRQIASHTEARSLRREQAAAVAEFRSLRGELLSLLGLLAAVVAFISTSVGITSQLDLPDSIILLLTAGSVIIFVFTSFESAFGRRSGLKSALPSITMALLMATAAAVIWWVTH